MDRRPDVDHLHPNQGGAQALAGGRAACRVQGPCRRTSARTACDKVSVVDAVPAEDVLSINTPQELQVVDAILRRRLGIQAGASVR